VIDDLDNLLHDLLVNSLPPMTPALTVSFETPDNQFPPSSVHLPTVNLFLYDIRENRDLRSNEWLIDRQGDGAVKKRSPVRVDCSYLITAWVATGGSVQTEHNLLGEVLRVLLRHPTLPSALLPTNLKDQIVDLPTTAIHAGYLQSVAEFWQALGGRPRAALNYTVTLGVDAQPAQPTEPPALGGRFNLRSSTGGA
jgi:Pvc16 N-terminal domain